VVHSLFCTDGNWNLGAARIFSESSKCSSHSTLFPQLIMKYIVDLYVGGKVFKEEVQATNPKDARETAMARNPRAKVVGVNVSFK
jgi:hypothetical protein